MRALIFITIFVSILIINGVQGAPCGGYGTTDGMYCNCFGGYSPDYSKDSLANCDITAMSDSTCATHSPGDFALVSGNYAPTLLDESNPVKFERDRLVITFKQPITKDGWQRTTTKINFHRGHTTGTLGSTSCRYPGSMWQKLAKKSACQDEYEFRMLWEKYDLCGFQKVPTTSYLIYTTTVEFTYTVRDSANPSVTREMTNLFHFNIRLARQKTLSASLKLALDKTKDAEVSSVVVSSVYDLLARRTIVVFQTQTSWPYKIASPITTPASSGPSLAIPDSKVVVTPDYLTPDNCEQSSGSICVQQFVVTINSTSESCDDIAEEYTLQTELICADIDTCTPVAGPEIVLSIDTPDCTPTLVNSTQFATNALISFSDSTFTSPASDFETGDLSHWAFAVIDPSVSIDAVTLSSVKLSSVADDTIYDVVYSASAPPSDNKLQNVVNTKPGVVFPPGNAAVVSFSLPLNRGVLSNTLGSLAPGDAAEALSLEVVADITYHGNQRKRLVGFVRPHNNNQAASISSFVVRSPRTGAANGSVKQSDASQAKSMCTDSNSLSCAALSLVWKALGLVGL